MAAAATSREFASFAEPRTGARRAGRGTVQLQVLSCHHHGLFYHLFILISAAPGCLHSRDGSIRAKCGQPWGYAPVPDVRVSAILAASAAAAPLNLECTLKGAAAAL